MTHPTIKTLIDTYQKHFYIEDTSAIPLVCAVILGNRMKGDPIWLCLIGGSSSGKTELINAVCGLDFVFQLSTLTANTLLSGAPPTNGKETSLLLQIPRNAIMVMKDFNTLISMNREEQQAIMGQLLQVYDGEMSKSTGTGKTINWKGKIGFIAGVTENIHIFQSRYSTLGNRFINYTFPTQDRIKTTVRSALIAKNKKEIREEIKKVFAEYINYMIPIVSDREDAVPPEISEQIIKVADFSTLARSPVSRDFQGRMELVLSPEMPMRVSDMLHLNAKTFMAMEDGKLLPEYEKILYKICLDNIPKGRRMALRVLTEYDSITTKGFAMKIGYETDRARMWLEELNVLGICHRDRHSGNKGDKWKIKKEYRDIMNKYDHVNISKEELGDDDEDDKDFNDFEKEVAEFKKAKWDNVF